MKLMPMQSCSQNLAREWRSISMLVGCGRWQAVHNATQTDTPALLYWAGSGFRRVSGSGGGEGPKSAKTGIFVENGLVAGVLRTCKRRFLVGKRGFHACQRRRQGYRRRLQGCQRAFPVGSRRLQFWQRGLGAGGGLPGALARLPAGFPSREPAFAVLPMAFAAPPSGGASGRARLEKC